MTVDRMALPEERRSEIRARIERALADRPRVHPVPRGYRRRLPEGVDVLDLFASRVGDYRATVHQTDAAGLASTVGEITTFLGIRRLVVPAGFPGAWLAASTTEPVSDHPQLSVDALDAIDATITTCAVAIAETGTVVLDGGPGQGRRALSLLPDRLICVVNADQVVGTVPEAIERLDPMRPLTWISGPSATSDIELQRIEGVHGPRALHVILVAAAGRPRAAVS